jgi:hypothetical protein
MTFGDSMKKAAILFFVLTTMLLLVVGCSNDRTPEGQSPSAEVESSSSNSLLKDYVRNPLNSAEGVSDEADRRNQALEDAASDE